MAKKFDARVDSTNAPLAVKAKVAAPAAKPGVVPDSPKQKTVARVLRFACRCTLSTPRPDTLIKGEYEAADEAEAKQKLLADHGISATDHPITVTQLKG